MAVRRRKARRLLLLLWLALCLLPVWPGHAAPPMAAVDIRLFKAGKADAFLIRAGDQVILIDTAEADDGDKILTYMARQGITRVDMLIITHFDKGHIGGAADILNTVTVGRVLMPDARKQSGTYTRFREALSRSKARQVILQENTAFETEGLKVDIFVATSRHYPEDQDDGFSLVTRLTHGQNTLLFTGDIPSQRIREMMDTGEDWQADFLQVPAHGRDGPMTEAFMRAVQPRYAVITCSDKNPPAPAVLALLESLGTQTWLTVDGHIDLTSDGHTITIKQ